MKRVALVATAASIAISTCTAHAGSCSYVKSVSGQKERFFIKPQACHSQSCTSELASGARISVPPGNHKLVYVPPALPKDRVTLRSSVLFQITREGGVYSNKKIRLRRPVIDGYLDCKSKANNKSARFPLDKVIDYEAYDRWHRNNRNPRNGKPYDFLKEDFHFLYDNGKSCTVTFKDPYLRRFLFERRNNVANIIQAAFNTLRSRRIVGTVEAAPLAPVSKRSLQVMNYYMASRNRRERPCVEIGFDVNEAESLTIQVDDLDGKKVRNNDFNSTLHKFTFINVD